MPPLTKHWTLTRDLFPTTTSLSHTRKSLVNRLGIVLDFMATLVDGAGQFKINELNVVAKKIGRWALQHFTGEFEDALYTCKVCLADGTADPAEVFKVDRTQHAIEEDPLCLVQHLQQRHDLDVQLVPDTSEYVKCVVFGGLDGIMTKFAVISAAAGGNLDWKSILLVAIANCFSDGFSMGFSEYVGGAAELTHALSERAREDWEVENCKEMEVQEMIDFFRQRGFEGQDAEEMVAIISKDQKLFVEFMMIHELGISVDTEDTWGPLKQANVMFWSFLAFGFLPILPYLSGTGQGVDGTFWMSIVITALALWLLGVIRGRMTGFSVTKSALIIMFFGAVNGAVCYVVASVVGMIVGDVPPIQ